MSRRAVRRRPVGLGRGVKSLQVQDWKPAPRRIFMGKKNYPPRGFVSHGGSTDTPHDRPQVPAIVHGFSTCGRPSLPGACLRSSLESAREETPGRTTTRRGAQAPALSNPVQPATPGHVGEPGRAPDQRRPAATAGRTRRRAAPTASACWPRPRAGRAPDQRRPAARSGPVAFFLVLTCGRRSGQRRPAAAAGRARHRAAPTPAACSTRAVLARCRYWMCRPALQHRGLSATPAYPHHVFMLNFCLFGWLRPRFPSGSGPPCGALRMQSELSTSRSTAIPQFLSFDCGNFYSIKSTS